MSLDAYLKENGIVGIQGIDTRALVRHIRDKGAQTGIVSSIDLDPERLVEKARKAPSIVGRDLVKEVTCRESYHWTEGPWDLEGRVPAGRQAGPLQGGGLRFRHQAEYPAQPGRLGLRRDRRPCRHPGGEGSLAMNPDGIFLSNGPGDPEPVRYAQENIRKLLGKKPIFGICLGHQLLSIALGGKTYKLKFGHRGGNQPVLRGDGHEVEITAQNHGFAVDCRFASAERRS